ncbi:MAG: hypothetical protein CL920_27265 [Deltaproteobacteria bacterium]|nr:hypothetical protein [Deltaproteobacteria bacterium]MBU52411.1 hypothetical protein [Deltaproteobacteria bacterium]
MPLALTGALRLPTPSWGFHPRPHDAHASSVLRSSSATASLFGRLIQVKHLVDISNLFSHKCRMMENTIPAHTKYAHLGESEDDELASAG